jgi:hypothetical protein
MFGSVLCLATAVLGVDIGWQPNAQGELEYVVQLSPEMAEGLFAGRPVEFGLPPEHQGVRHFRIQVGKGVVPREGSLAPPAAPRVETAAKAALPTASNQKAPEKPPEKPPQTPLEKPPAAEKNPAAPAGQTVAGQATGVKLPGLPGSETPRSQSASTAETPPNVLRIDPNVRPLGSQPASYNEPTKPTPSPPGGRTSPGDAQAGAAPLLMAWGTAAGLLAALVYLIWVHLGTRRRYQALLAHCAAVGVLPGSGEA